MENQNELLELLRRMEANQQKFLENQQESLAISRAQVKLAEERIQESFALQKDAISRQKKAMYLVWLVIFLAVFYLVRLIVRL